MSFRLFFIPIIAMSFMVHLLRLPYLVLENGGGAFLILLFVGIHLLAVPLLITEKILEEKVKKIDLSSLVRLKKSFRSLNLDSLLVSLWVVVKLVVLIGFFWFFLYLGNTAFRYTVYFGGFSFGLIDNVRDVPSLPQMRFSLLGSFLWSLFVFFVFFKIKKSFLYFSNRWVLPFCMASILFLFVKILTSVSDYSGFKSLFYPDFSSLNLQSLKNVLGHSLLSLFVGLGFYKHSSVENKAYDWVEIFIFSSIATTLIALFVGAMALPLVEQSGAYPFGPSFVFENLPRWLSYTEFGYYYCFVFLLTFSYISVYFSIVFLDLLVQSRSLFFSIKGKPRLQIGFNAFFVVAGALVINVIQKNFVGWEGQGTLLFFDNLVINMLMPLLCLLSIWFTFKYTGESDQFMAFSKQQVFFHNKIFFIIWKQVNQIFVPLLFLSLLLLGAFGLSGCVAVILN